MVATNETTTEKYIHDTCYKAHIIYYTLIKYSYINIISYIHVHIYTYRESLADFRLVTLDE